MLYVRFINIKMNNIIGTMSTFIYDFTKFKPGIIQVHIKLVPLAR